MNILLIYFLLVLGASVAFLGFSSVILFKIFVENKE